MRTGVEVAFAAANEAGGVHGRKLQLVGSTTATSDAHGGA